MYIYIYITIIYIHIYNVYIFMVVRNIGTFSFREVAAAAGRQGACFSCRCSALLSLIVRRGHWDLRKLIWHVTFFVFLGFPFFLYFSWLYFPVFPDQPAPAAAAAAALVRPGEIQKKT